MNKEQNTQKQWLPLWISISMIAGMLIGFSMRDQFPSTSFFSFEKKSVLGEIEALIKKKYVDEVDLKSINDSAIQTILAKLDPHSVHIPAQDLESVNDDIHGQFVGVGIEFISILDTTNIVRLIPGGSAEKNGLKIGDQIIEADGKSLIGLKEDSIRSKIKGAEKSNITLTIKRLGELQKIRLPRTRISINSIEADYMINKEVGYIKLAQFTTETYREFMTSLTELKKQGMVNLILDLRGNTGGVLDEAVEIADEFLSGDKLITYTEGKHLPKKEYRCKREGQFENGDLILLCDEESASASEILLGALQDWDRAKILGTRSFGKGLVQEQYELSDNSALRLTVARYFTPIGRCIQRSYANGKAAYYMNETSDSTNKKRVFLSSKGKKLYDGGGIEPDIKIDQDSLFSQTYDALYEKGIQISRLAYITYLSQKKSGTTVSKVGLSNNWINTLPDSISTIISSMKPEIIQIITQNVEANISRMEEGVSAYQKTLNRYDPVVKAAVLSLTK
jgi:carboxyl-terminal processing protease